MSSLFLDSYLIVLYILLRNTITYIEMDWTTDLDDKIYLTIQAYFLYIGSLVVIYCQFAGLAALHK